MRITVVSAIAEIPAEVWDGCANPTTTAASGSPAATCGAISELAYNPFVSHAFLSALEASRSAWRRTGWEPRHLFLEDADGTALGVVPCWLKSHSRGEYVFDHGWADAYERAGGQYYPKLQVAVPFTPATGRRLLVAPGPHADIARAVLLDGLKTLCGRDGASSAHVTFMTEAEWRLAGAHGWLQRTDQQFHWDNPGYATFDDFLAALAARKRKAIKRERREAVENGIEIVRLSGTAIDEEAWDAFFAFYMDTGSRKWGRPYLTRDFFSRVGATMADRILLVMAKRAGRYVAGALNFIGGDTLFGRHWGAVEHHPFLHFELCYYQAIEFAIERRLARVEAGAQGEHKLARGYLPNTTWSAHYIADPALRRAIADYLKRERAYVDAAARELAAASPFRKDGFDIRPPAEEEMETD
ncbi:GNAT family N-acetyltransferase [Rhodoplanes sp. TEM]|uniref:GNAT family N-acetyltransferase n=1 Tax=Rhodoplanes tepidamans TaxID=200616 RepID=A0ABT5J722_RHOTP|nr:MULTISPECIES: GNAT family N-acetyltransferase [Rhodoplanes]MDC7785257.1 GNAT family N-acetyltransferase [Rhodoplanes tepidamans]MDC7984676.1 GNAT family N-acetyltransferase [Rhodoplanes sp. TEM]